MGLRPASQIAEILRLIEILDVPGDPKQLDQPNLDFLMPGRFVQLSRGGSEGFADQVCAFERDVEQTTLVRGLEMRHRRFVKVPEIIEFVASRQLGPAGGAEKVQATFRIDRSRRIEVAIGFLRSGDLRDQVIQIMLQLRVGMHRHCVGRTLNDFVDVRIVKRGAAKLAGHELARLGEIVDPSGFLALLEVIPDGGQAVGFHPRCPEAVLDPDLGEGDWLDWVILEWGGGKQCGKGSRTAGQENDRRFHWFRFVTQKYSTEP